MSPVGHDPATPPLPRANPWLLAGAASGPVFYGLVVAQIILRPGFDFMRHPLSLLSLGETGWVQRAAFVLAGLLVLAGASGLSRGRRVKGAQAWITRLLFVFGIGTLLAGVFTPDPAMGFPPGTPESPPATMSAHSMLHGICFDLSFVALIAAVFVSGIADLRSGDRGWAGLSLASGAALPLLIVGGFLAPASMGACFFAAGAVAFGWASLNFLRSSRRGVG